MLLKPMDILLIKAEPIRLLEQVDLQDMIAHISVWKRPRDKLCFMAEKEQNAITVLPMVVKPLLQKNDGAVTMSILFLKWMNMTKVLKMDMA